MQEQTVLGALVRGHRRKFPWNVFNALPDPGDRPAKRLCVLLRLAVLLHRSREATRLPDIQFEAGNASLTLSFPNGWLDDNPLTHTDLQQEKKYLKDADFKLSFA